MPAKWNWPLDVPVRVSVKAWTGETLLLVPYGFGQGLSPRIPGRHTEKRLETRQHGIISGDVSGEALKEGAA